MTSKQQKLLLNVLQTARMIWIYEPDQLWRFPDMDSDDLDELIEEAYRIEPTE